uniref:Uncharacterized protein n=1 Tax=Tanacetum cinerariifolium TaxID=118510 RepID=A0A6L2NM33_TANCI|nr:hypothetical protein [Tanacetum cinerariifolium]
MDLEGMIGATKLKKSILQTMHYATLKKQYDSLSLDYKKSQFNLVSYKAGLQSVEERLVHYKKNEAAFTDKNNILNLKVKLRDNALVEYTKKLEKAEKERDELKLTLEKYQNSSKSLNTLLESQVSDKVKTGLGYKAASLAVEDFVNSSKLIENQENVKSRSDKGYHLCNPQQKEYKEKGVINSGCFKQSHELPLLRVNTLGSRKDKITYLKKIVKRLEKKRKSRTLQLKRRLFKVRIESSAKKSLGDQEDASNQGRNDQDEGISFVQEDAEIQERYSHDTEINTASTSITTASINITTDEPITTISTPITITGVSVSTAEPRGVIIRESGETPTRPIVPLQQKLDPKDKGKGKMVEPEKPLKNKDRIKFYKEVAQRLQAQFEKKERMARQQEENANIAE